MESSTWYVIKQRLTWIKMHERGVPATGAPKHYGISRKTLYKWLRRYQEAGQGLPCPQGQLPASQETPGLCLWPSPASESR